MGLFTLAASNDIEDLVAAAIGNLKIYEEYIKRDPNNAGEMTYLLSFAVGYIEDIEKKLNYKSNLKIPQPSAILSTDKGLI